MAKLNGSLTPKQEAFARAYVETGNASEAYRRAYAASKMSVHAVEVEASKLLANPEVTLRVSDLHSEHANRHDITVDSLTTELEKARQGAEAANQYGAAVSAILGKAKLHGLIVDKTKMDGQMHISHEDRLAALE